MKRKMLAVLAVAAVATTLAACGGSQTNGGNGVGPSDNHEIHEPHENERAAPAPRNVTGMERGVWDGDTFYSQYLGLRFRLPENWAVLTDEDIAEMIGISADMMGITTELTEEFWDLIDTTVIYDMYATNLALGTNVAISFERLIFPRNNITATQYIESAIAILADMPGMTINFNPEETVTIGAYNWHTYEAVISMMGLEMSVRSFVNVQDGFARVIQHGGFSDSLEEVLAMFEVW